MALFSKDGKDFIEVSDKADDLHLLTKEGYKMYMTYTDDGQDYVTIPATVKDDKLMRESGYKLNTEWDYEQKVKEESKVKFGAGEAAAQGFQQGATFGLGDEVVARIKSLLPEGSSYQKELEAVRYQQKAAEEQHPIASGVGKLAGTLAPALIPGVGKALTGPTLASTIGRGMLSGGISQALTSYGETEKTDLADQAKEAAKGAIVGAGIGALGGAATAVAPALLSKGKEAVKTGIETIKSPIVALKSSLEAVDEATKSRGILGVLNPLNHVKAVTNNLDALAKESNEYKVLTDTIRTELGPTAKNLSDSDLVNVVASLPGEHPLKAFAADRIEAASKGKLDKDTILTFLNQGGEIYNKARTFNKIDTTEGLAEEFSKVAKNLTTDMSARYKSLSAAARESMSKQDAETPNLLIESLNKISSYKRAPDRIKSALEDAHKELSVGKTGIPWEEASPQEQFDRLIFTRREILDPEIKWSKKEDYTQFEKELRAVRGDLDSRLKSLDDMAEADASYSTFKNIQKTVFKRLGTVDDLTGDIEIQPTKLEALFSDSKAGREIDASIKRAKSLLEEKRLPEEEAKPLKDLLDSIDSLQSTARLQKAAKKLETYSKEPKGSEMERTAGLLGSKSFITEAVRSPKMAFRIREQLSETAKDLYGSAFESLTPAQQAATVRYQMFVQKNPKASQVEKTRILNSINAQLGIKEP